MVMACEESAPREFDFAENPCGLDGPVKLTDSVVLAAVEFDAEEATVLTRTPSEVPRRGLGDVIAAERINMCGEAENQPSAIPLTPVGAGGYRCGPLGLHWTDDLATPPVELRHDVTDCRGVSVTEQGLFLAEDGVLLRYRTPFDEPEVVVTDIDTEVIYGQGYSSATGWPLAVHGDDLFYLATGGAVRSVDLRSGLRSLLADGAVALYGHPDKDFVVWVERLGNTSTSTVYFPDRQQAVQLRGSVGSIARHGDWITTQGDNFIGMYAPKSNALRERVVPGTVRVNRVEGDWAYLTERTLSDGVGGSVVALELSSGRTETLLTSELQLFPNPNPYGEGVIVDAVSTDDALGRIFIVDRSGADEIARDVPLPYALLGDGSVLFEAQDSAGNLAVKHRLRSGAERVVAWNAEVLATSFEALRGDALFVVFRGEHTGLWRMPAIP